MSKTQILFFVFCVCFISSFSQQEKNPSQKTPQDFELWNTINVEKKIFKKTVLSVQQSVRLRENATQFNSTFTDVGLGYEIVKNLKIELNGRFIIRDKDATNNQRIYGIIDYAKNIQRFDFGLRTRFEKQYEVNKIPSKTWRNRLKLSYNIPNIPLEPFIYFEVFADINNLQNQMTRTRLCAGSNYKINKQSSLSLYYIYQDDFNIENLSKSYILGIEYDLKLKKFKPKKKKEKQISPENKS